MRITLNDDFLELINDPLECYTFLHIARLVDENYNLTTTQSQMGKVIGRNRDTTRNVLDRLEMNDLIYQKIVGKKTVIHVNERLEFTFPEIDAIEEKREQELENEEDEKFLSWMEYTYPRVSKLEQPLTREQYESLQEEFYLDRKKLNAVLDKLENYKPLQKNCVSAYKTLRSWIRKDRGD